MQVSLRKAAQLQVAINDKLKTTSLVTTAQINIFEEPNAQIQAIAATEANKVIAVRELIYALGEIRTLVGKANSAEGIDETLTLIAAIDRTEKVLAPLQTASAQYTPAILKARFDRATEASKDLRYGGSEHFVAPVFASQTIQGFKEEAIQLARRKQALKDRLIHLNQAVKVDLSDAVERILQLHGII